MTPEQMLQKYMDMSRFVSRQSISQSLPGRALGALAQGGASLASAGASSAASVAARGASSAASAVVRAAPVVARAGLRATSAGARALSSAGGVGLRATSAGARALSSVGSAAKRALSARGRRSPEEALLPDNVLGELRERGIDPGAVAKAMAGPRRRGIDLEDARARVMRQAMAL